MPLSCLSTDLQLRIGVAEEGGGYLITAMFTGAVVLARYTFAESDDPAAILASKSSALPVSVRALPVRY